jgi:hypothetical protein
LIKIRETINYIDTLTPSNFEEKAIKNAFLGVA